MASTETEAEMNAPGIQPNTWTVGINEIRRRDGEGDYELRLTFNSMSAAAAWANWLARITQDHCHASGRNSDGECVWEACPQTRDNEPRATGRHCPLDTRDED